MAGIKICHVNKNSDLAHTRLCTKEVQIKKRVIPW